MNCSCNSYQAPKYTMYKEGWGSTEVAGDNKLIVFLHWDGNMKWVNHFLLKSTLSHNWSCCLTYEYLNNILPPLLFCSRGVFWNQPGFWRDQARICQSIAPQFQAKKAFTPLFSLFEHFKHFLVSFSLKRFYHDIFFKNFTTITC